MIIFYLEFIIALFMQISRILMDSFWELFADDQVK